ncbi:MAG: PIG-L family deacetylase [Gemmatimonadetes bacterium]|nr:PIG-L family deacetylase [Gemmatimonadota bacterium]NNM06572.1 PIG-L family deacetylase [Gemmatimonadota bacterium]
MLKKSILLSVLALFAACGPSQGQSSNASNDPDLQPWLSSGLVSQDDPWTDGIVGTGLLLRRLDGVKRVLMIGAHPDDEDTSLLTALARGMGVETAYLSLTRGEGGQNLIGPEMGEGLGLVRTGELLSARALDGGRQFFTRAFDFGYSKNAEETFGFWPREEILRDVTWVVRTFRPQVIVSVFSGTPRDGHGHHQVAGILAHEVFDVAADPSRFPDQIAAGVPAWAPQKLYRLTRRNPQEGTAGLETGAFDPLLGRSHLQVAMDSRSQHRSQDMGMAQPMGPRRSTVALVESRMKEDGADEIFAGVDTALVALARDLPVEIRDEVTEGLEAYRRSVALATEALAVTDPWASAPFLGEAVTSLKAVLETLRVGGGAEGKTDAGVDLERTLRNRMPLVQEALLRSAGLVVDVRVADDLLVPGETVDGVISLWNGGSLPLSGAAADIFMPQGWIASGDLGAVKEVPPGTMAQWSFRFQVPTGADASRAYYMAQPRDGELYHWPSDRGFWALPANPDLLHGKIAFRISDQEEAVEAFSPARYRGVDKATGEFLKPVQVVPAIAVSVTPGVMIWPSSAEGFREFTVSLSSQAVDQVQGTVSLELPGGWRSDPVERSFVLSPSAPEGTFSFRVTPSSDLAVGEYAIGAEVRTDDGRSYDDGVSLVDYPHIRRGALFPEALSRVSVFPVSMPEGLRVGYVMGSGDGGPEAIRQMGAEVELLGPEALRSGDLSRFDVLVLGIRVYETRPDAASANDRLLDFARGGGTLIVQYNKYEFDRGGFSPFPVAMNRPHDRISDETVPVEILDPYHPVFQAPNPIDQKDFDGWVQERGLYFLREWDPGLTPLLEMADPGEDPKRGGLLVGGLGEGVYAYTGLAFFRQFPEAVPGAYRLFANLVSLKASDLR